MPNSRISTRDPRSLSRDIPGLLDIVFPRLSGGLVTSLNRGIVHPIGLQPISPEAIEATKIQRSLLFEISNVHAERRIGGEESPDWAECLTQALIKQNRFFDAKPVTELSDSDKEVALHASHNLVQMLTMVSKGRLNLPVDASPIISGFGWISSGHGDFSVGTTLVEVKNTDRNFIAADYRQILMYWALSYANAVERDVKSWSECVLLNPRRNAALLINYDTLINSASGGLNRVEVYELLRSVIGQSSEQLR